MVTTVDVSREQVELLLGVADVRKTIGPDDVSSQALKHCTNELLGPLLDVFMFTWRKTFAT